MEYMKRLITREKTERLLSSYFKSYPNMKFDDLISIGLLSERIMLLIENGYVAHYDDCHKSLREETK